MTIETQISASVKASAWATLSRVTERFLSDLRNKAQTTGLGFLSESDQRNYKFDWSLPPRDHYMVVMGRSLYYVYVSEYVVLAPTNDKN
ncbi:MAG: hypothetical protein VXY71_02830 [Pseudomonadota bacterium]|nr:hypothetical protein [Pseudomonadota bacterium]